MTGRANVVDRVVEGLHAGLADITDLEIGRTTLVGRGNRAAAAAEVTIVALGCGSGQSGLAAVVAGCARCALRHVLQAWRVAVRSVGAQELGGEARARGAVASGGARAWRRCVLKAIRAGGTRLAGGLAVLVLVGSCGTD
jgi:hypothetical protein